MSFINIDELKALPLKKQIDIKKSIIKETELAAIPIVFLPDVISDEYYFISYSHRDYVAVYCDIFDMQLLELPIWYDRGIPAGNSWKEVAMKYIAPFACKGTIFYISENALTSNAVVEEIKSALYYKKPFLVILISKENETLRELIERLYQEEKITAERHAFFLDVFKEEIIYLRINEPCETKVEKIKSCLPHQTKLVLEKGHYKKIDHNSVKDGCAVPIGFELEIGGINDYFTTEVTINDYLDLIEEGFDDWWAKIEYNVSFGDDDTVKFVNPERDLEKIKTLRVSFKNLALANIHTLERVVFPAIGEDFGHGEIGDYAFYNCTNLKVFKRVFRDLPNLDRLKIGKSAFEGCSSLEAFDFRCVEFDEKSFSKCLALKEVDLSNAACKIVTEEGATATRHIPTGAFGKCLSLEKLIFPKRLEYIDSIAFTNCPSLKELVLPSSLKVIGNVAFAFCKGLTKITLNDGLEKIDSGAFARTGLEEVSLPLSLKELGKGVFDGCPSLKKINYPSTIEEFKKIATNDIASNCPNDIVISCADGSFTIEAQPSK